MTIVNIHDAKTNLSRLIERALAGEFLAGAIQVPDDFDRMGADEIDGMFGGAR